MILSIIIPVYNEEKTIIEILKKIKKNSSSAAKYEVSIILTALDLLIGVWGLPPFSFLIFILVTDS